MAKIEIDENEYADLKRVAEVAKVIGANPKAREMLQQAVALAAPEQAGPEIRIRQEVTERIGGLEKTLTDFISEQKKDREEREAASKQRELEERWLQSRSKAREAGYTAEGLEKLEEFMEKNGVADHSLAIPAFEKLNPPPEPVMTGSSGWNFFDQAKDNLSIEALMKGDTDAFLAQAIPDALKDARGR